MMEDKNKTREQLLNELSELRRRIAGLKTLEADAKRIQEVFQKSETRHRSLYSMVRLMCDNVPDLIWAKDLEKKYVFTNRAICEQLLNAKDTDEPLGKTDMFFAERERQSHPDNPRWHTFGEICADSDAVVINNKTPQRFDEFGNVKGEFLFLDVYKAPFLDENGNIIGTVGCGRDVTKEKRMEEERKKMAERLRKSEEKFRNIFNNAPVGIYRLTPEGRFMGANPAAVAIFGYTSPEDLMGSITDISAQIYAYPEERSEAFRLQREQGFLKDFEARCRRKDGDIVWALFNTSPVRDNKGNILCYEGTCQDITDRKWLEEELKGHRERLEHLVAERTAELMHANERLRQEMEERKKAMDELKKGKEELENKSRTLEEVNTALKVLLKQRDEDKKDLEENIMYNMERLVLPYIQNLKMHPLTESQKLNMDVLETNLKEIISPFLRNIAAMHRLYFTPRETEIINLIKTGKTTKEIAALLNVGKGAIDLHRGHIRKKLGLSNIKGNLQSYLSSLG